MLTVHRPDKPDNVQRAYKALETMLEEIRKNRWTGEFAVKVVAKEGGLMDVKIAQERTG